MSGLVLVTGATGTVGRRLVAELRSRGRRVRALIHRSDATEADEWVRGDLADAESLAAAVSGTEAVIHLAAVTHARSEHTYRTVNVDGTARLVEAATQEGVGRFIYVSTRAIDASGGAYSRSKADAERRVRQFAGSWVIVRLPEVYGAGGREGVDRVIELVRAGRFVPVVGSGRDELCPVHIDDAVAALAAALDSEAAARKTYTLAGSSVTSAELVRLCSATLGTPARTLHVPAVAVAALSVLSRLLPLPLYPDQLARLRAPKPTLSPEAGSDLGFQPRALARGIQA